MLQGTFDTLSLPELLGLLAHSQKTGTLWLEAGPATAAIYLADGRCCAAQSGDLTGKVDDAAALLGRVVELCFAAARQDDGAFRFGSEEPPWVCPETVDLDAAVDELARLLDEWREIQAVIPTLDAGFGWPTSWASTSSSSTANVGRCSSRSTVVAPCASWCARRTARRSRSATRSSRSSRPGAITVVQTASSAAPRGNGRAAKAEPKSLVKPEDPYGPGVESPQGGPGADAVRRGSRAGKGDYLRVFTALKDH